MAKYKLTPIVQENLCKLLELGVPPASAASVVGITRQTFWYWMKEGEQAKSGKMREFYEMVQACRDKAIARNVSHVQKAASEGIWQAAAWFLERTDPDNFGRYRNEPQSSIPLSPTGLVNTPEVKEAARKLCEGLRIAYDAEFEEVND